MIICFESHRKDRKAWSIKFKNKWYYTKQVVCMIPVYSVYKGPKARQPKAYFEAFGKIVIDKNRIVIVSRDTCIDDVDEVKNGSNRRSISNSKSYSRNSLKKE